MAAAVNEAASPTVPLKVQLRAPAAERTEDWRILAVLGPYRLLLVTTLLTLHRSGFAPEFFGVLKASTFFYGCLIYALLALVLLVLGVFRRPRVRIQAHLHLFVDMLTIGTLVYGAGGISSGLGMLLVPPVVGSSLVLSPRLAAVHAAMATLTMFGAEAIHQINTHTLDGANYSQTGLLGLMFFVSSLVANTVAQRARRSEAMAQRVGSEFVNLSRLSENIIESMQTGVLVVDAGNRIRVANAAGRRLVGDDLPSGATLPQAVPALHAALQQWRDGRGDSALPLAIDASGRELMVRFTRLGWGAEAQILLSLEDASLLREQAQQIKLAALGRLSAGIAHEIRNPLSAITQASQLLAESATLDPGNHRLLDMVQRHAARIERIVRDVLDLSRRNSADQVRLRLREWLTRTAALYHESYPQGARPIELTDVPAELYVQFDVEHLQQVLFNLWDNSFSHGAPAQRAATVMMQATVSDDDEAVVLDVLDDGPGIPPELHERIFEPFFTSTSTGTGLGLYLCRELCEYNQARINHVPSRHGAMFRIRFRGRSGHRRVAPNAATIE